jgi:hypothetical protein
MKEDETIFSITPNGELVFDHSNGCSYDFLGFSENVFGNCFMLKLRKD